MTNPKTTPKPTTSEAVTKAGDDWLKPREAYRKDEEKRLRKQEEDRKRNQRKGK